MSNLPVRYRPASRTGGKTLIIAAIGMAVMTVWSMNFSVDQVIRAPGQIVPIDGNQVVQADDNGILTSLAVKEGQVVKKGQLLAVLDKGHAEASFQEAEAQISSLNATIARLNAEISGHAPEFSEDLVKKFPELVANERSLYEARQAGLHQTLAGLEENLAAARAEYQANVPLAENGDISQVELLHAKRAMTDAQISIVIQKTKYAQDAASELATARINLQSFQNVLKERKGVLAQTNITAKVDGIVKSIKIPTVGAVLHSGDELMQIFPTSSHLIVEAKIKPSDMFKISPGLHAKVRLDNYDYSTYGDLPASVVYVSNDAITEDSRLGPAAMVYYKVKLDLDDHAHSPASLKLSPGMTVTVYVKTGSRSVFQYIFKPVTRTLDAAMSEK